MLKVNKLLLLPMNSTFLGRKGGIVNKFSCGLWVASCGCGLWVLGF